MDRTGEALQNIVASVEDISAQVSEIASSSQQQAEGLGEINEGMNRLDSVTQQNAAMVEEATADNHAIRHEAVILAELTSLLETGEARAETPVNQSGAPGSDTRLKITSLEQNTRRTTVQIKPVKRAVGDGLVDQNPVSSESEGWEDF